MDLTVSRPSAIYQGRTSISDLTIKYAASIYQYCDGSNWYSMKGTAGQTFVYLTAGTTTWTVPSDWTTSGSTVEGIGAAATARGALTPQVTPAPGAPPAGLNALTTTGGAVGTGLGTGGSSIASTGGTGGGGANKGGAGGTSAATGGGGGGGDSTGTQTNSKV